MEEVETKKRRAAKEWGEKRWYKILAPSAFGGAMVGETPAIEQKQLLGRTFETTLGDLINDFSKSHIKLYFQAKEVKGDQIQTMFIGHEMARDYIESQVRRRASKIDAVATVTTKDGYELRVSAMVITLKRISSSQIDAIHKLMIDVIRRGGSERTLDQFVQEAVLGKLASDIYKVVKRICPVRRIEVWKTKVLNVPH